MPSEEVARPQVSLPLSKESTRGDDCIVRAASQYLTHLESAAAGDERALTALIEEFSPMVYAVALRATESVADAEDIMQDVFIGLPEALRGFTGGPFPAWLKLLTRRYALSKVRSDLRREQRATSFLVADRVEERTLSRILVEKALEHVDPDLRDVFVLREFEGLTHTEIADRLGITEGASHARQHRAKVALRQIIGEANG